MRCLLLAALLCMPAFGRCVKSDGFRCVEYKRSSISALEFAGYRLTVKAKATKVGSVAYSWMLFTPYPFRFQFQSELVGVADGRPEKSNQFKVNCIFDF